MDFDSTDDEKAMRQQVADLVRVYLDNVPKDEKPLAVEVAAEAPLVDPITGEDLGMPLVGILDLCWTAKPGRSLRFQDGGKVQRTDGNQQRDPTVHYAWLHRQITGQQEGGLEIRSLIKTKVPKMRVPSLRGPHGCPLRPALRRDPRVSRRPRRRPAQLPARLQLRDVRLPPHALHTLGRIGPPLAAEWPFSPPGCVHAAYLSETVMSRTTTTSPASPAPRPHWHKAFLGMLPAILKHAKIAFGLLNSGFKSCVPIAARLFIPVTGTTSAVSPRRPASRLL